MPAIDLEILLAAWLPLAGIALALCLEPVPAGDDAVESEREPEFD